MNDNRPQVCGPDCRYRNLYHGSQASLSDMAARQAEALSRLGRLKGGVIDAMKRSFARQFVDAERQSGQRFHDQSDEVIISYLASFLSNTAAGQATTGMHTLRDELIRLGITLPQSEDPADWAKSVKTWREESELVSLFDESYAAKAPKPEAPAPVQTKRRGLVRRAEESTLPTTPPLQDSATPVAVSPTASANSAAPVGSTEAVSDEVDGAKSARRNRRKRPKNTPREAPLDVIVVPNPPKTSKSDDLADLFTEEAPYTEDTSGLEDLFDAPPVDYYDTPAYQEEDFTETYSEPTPHTAPTPVHSTPASQDTSTQNSNNSADTHVSEVAPVQDNSAPASAFDVVGADGLFDSFDDEDTDDTEDFLGDSENTASLEVDSTARSADVPTEEVPVVEALTPETVSSSAEEVVEDEWDDGLPSEDLADDGLPFDEDELEVSENQANPVDTTHQDSPIVVPGEVELPVELKDTQVVAPVKQDAPVQAPATASVPVSEPHSPEASEPEVDELADLFAEDSALVVRDTPFSTPRRTLKRKGLQKKPEVVPSGLSLMNLSQETTTPKQTVQVTQQAAMEAPLRPQLFPGSTAPSKTRRRGGKSARISATPPGGEAVNAETSSTELDDTLREKLLASIAIPRPMFISDLAGVAGGDESIVRTWEEECRAQDLSPVRFIPPKARHRQMGSLVLPTSYLRTASTEGQESLWGEAMERYRGAKLYELAVLIHSLHDDIIQYDCYDHVVALTAKQGGNIVGIVVLLDDNLDTLDPARKELVDAMDKSLKVRSVRIAALSTNHQVVQNMVDVLEQEGKARNWAPSMMPVVAGACSSYVDTSGKSLTLILDN